MNLKLFNYYKQYKIQNTQVDAVLYVVKLGQRLGSELSLAKFSNRRPIRSNWCLRTNLEILIFFRDISFYITPNNTMVQIQKYTGMNLYHPIIKSV